MEMKRSGDCMTEVGRKLSAHWAAGIHANHCREWAQRVRPSDGLIVKET
jgi:hypothetical protein